MSMVIEGVKHLNVHESAAVFNVTTRTIDNWMKEGVIGKPRYIGKKAVRYWSVEEVNRCMSARVHDTFEEAINS